MVESRIDGNPSECGLALIEGSLELVAGARFISKGEPDVRSVPMAKSASCVTAPVVRVSPNRSAPRVFAPRGRGTEAFQPPPELHHRQIDLSPARRAPWLHHTCLPPRPPEPERLVDSQNSADPATHGRSQLSPRLVSRHREGSQHSRYSLQRTEDPGFAQSRPASKLRGIVGDRREARRRSFVLSKNWDSAQASSVLPFCGDPIPIEEETQIRKRSMSVRQIFTQFHCGPCGSKC